MQSLMELTQCVLADASTWCCVSTTRDAETVTRRVKNEGESFLTITLPQFCSDFERCLEYGTTDDITSWTGFSRKGALPKFLSGLLCLVFDSESGLLLDEPSTLAVFFIRQVCLLHKKVLLTCSEERERKAYAKYVECEEEVRAWEDHFRTGELLPVCIQPDLERFGRISDLLWAHDCSLIDRQVYEGQHVPKHGPGKTADRTVGNGKFDCGTWHSRLERHFNSSSFRIANPGFYEVLDGVTFLEPEAEIPVKVVTVPKTMKTPRIIAIEPTCMQYAQQSLMELFVDTLEKSDTLRGCIGFTDQTPNQDLARMASDKAFRSNSREGTSTIDLSEASDRVSNLLVRRMLKNFPSLSEAVQDCRSVRADVPGYGIMPLSKFASMGSALCFPIEAMVFFTIICVALEYELNRPLTLSDIHSLEGKVRVYGDDLIIPNRLARAVRLYLQSYGLKVNERKSFETGMFRESCGRDYFMSDDVSVTYNRRLLPLALRDASEIISAVSLRNQLYKAGLWSAARYVSDQLGKLATFPLVLETSPVLGFHSAMGYETQRMCEALHRPLVKGFVVKSRPKRSLISGEGALMKFFLKRGRDPIFDVKHLERYGRPDAVDIKLRWGPAF